MMRRHLHLTLLLCLLGFVSLAAYGESATGEPLHIAAASNFQHTLQRLHQEFAKAHAGELLTSFASSGKLYAQIRHGAPYDVFLSADAERPLKLVEDGLALADSRFTYAQGVLAFWSPSAKTFAQPEQAEQLLRLAQTRIAMANPRLAPYGLAAQQVLHAFASPAQAIIAESIAQAFHFAQSGNVDAGLVAYAQVLQWQTLHPQQATSVWLPDASLYDAIAQQAVLLTHAKDSAIAKDYLAFLRSAKAQQIITSSGYLAGEKP